MAPLDFYQPFPTVLTRYRTIPYHTRSLDAGTQQIHPSKMSQSDNDLAATVLEKFPKANVERDELWKSVTNFENQELSTLLENAPRALTSLAFCFAVTRLGGAGDIEPSYKKELYASHLVFVPDLLDLQRRQER